MTKDEIIDHYPIAASNSGDRLYMHLTDVKSAMGQYAKQQAIAFDEWKWANRWHSLENGFWYQILEHPSAMSDKTYNKHHRKTPQELYNQFIKQQTENK